MTEGGIIIPETHTDKYAMAQSIGTLIAVGPDCWADWFEFDANETVVGFRGRSGAYAKVGDRVIYAKYSGVRMPGADGEQYAIMNDEDITGTCDSGVDFTDWKSRHAMQKEK